MRCQSMHSCVLCAQDAVSTSPSTMLVGAGCLVLFVLYLGLAKTVYIPRIFGKFSTK